MIFLLLIIFFWIGAFSKGYFIETAFFSLNALLYIGFIVNLALSRAFIISKIHIVILLFVAGYWVSVLFAVDVEQAVLEAGRVSGLLPLSWMIVLLPKDKLTGLYKMWPSIGASTVIVGILFGMERNGRLESTFYYANALALLLLVSIIICILLFLQERRSLYMLLLTINAVGLLLTFSRSVWVLWLVMVCVMVVWLFEKRKRSAWLYIGLAHLCSLGLAMLIKGDWLFFWQRASTIQSNTSELQIRLVYWKASLGMIRDYWWGGTGGGGWNVLVHLYRSQDYYVKFVHNHYVQIALDIGVFGLAIFIVWLVIFYSTAIQRFRHIGAEESSIWYKGILLLVTTMLLHAGFDFDLTYPFLLGMLVCLTVPYGGKLFKLHVPNLALGMILPIAAGIICLWGWLAIGYGYHQAGTAYVEQGRYTEAQQSFARAEQMLPWSSSVLYGSAKGYVHQGNITGDTAYYQLAEEKLQLAHAMVPEQTLYTDLLEQIQTSARSMDTLKASNPANHPCLASSHAE